MIGSLHLFARILSRAWRLALCFMVFWAAVSSGAVSAATVTKGKPLPPRPRPSVEQRRTFEAEMKVIRPNRPGCFQAHFPEKRWVETQCLPAPRMPNPRAFGSRPNNVGDGTGRFAVVTSGNISQATGSFDSVTGVAQIDGFKGGSTTTVTPDVYELQMNANTFTTTIGGCNKISGCLGWEQFLMSQSQCGAKPCVFIEYWLLNYPSPCPTNASWNYYNGSTPGTTPGCYLNTPTTSLPSIPVSDLGSVTMNADISGGNDTVTISDASGTLGAKTYSSIAGLGSGWTGVEYGIYGDCCSVETFFTATTTATLKVRVAVVNGTQNAPTCATSFNGTTAETNNLNLTGGCTTVSGTAPAILYTMTGGGSLPAGVSIGDPHLTTFHRAHYDFQHQGEYILAEADPDFQVQVRQIIITPPSKPAIAYNVGAAVKMGQDRVAVTLKGVEINGQARSIPSGETIRLANDVTIDRRDSTYTVSRPVGDIVHINVLGDHLDVSVTVGATNAASVRGLLVGSGDVRVPFVGRNKKPVSLQTLSGMSEFIESWRVEPAESLFSEEGRPRPSGAIEPLTVAKLDPAKVAEARKQCQDRGVKEPTALEDCILDVSVMGRPELANGFVHAPRPRVVVPAR